MMQILLLGLGKMGLPLALNMRDQGFSVRAYDPSANQRQHASAENIIVAESLQSLFAQKGGKRIIWMMVPAGPAVDQILEEVLPLLDKGDILIDGGNSFYRDSQRRATLCAEKEVDYLDCGSSGGTSGARNGLCAMIGGNPKAFAEVEPIFQKITLPGGYLYCGPSGSGHFTKMVHNGIEYGMMQSIAEGFTHLRASGMDLDLPAIARLYNTGSVVRGWLMELTQKALAEDPGLESIRGVAHASGEAEWMVLDAMERKVSVPSVALSLMMRFQSQDPDNYPAKVVAALRNQFGGHAVEKKS
jgi:6-phosphogluconate dehydrogenase